MFARLHLQLIVSVLLSVVLLLGSVVSSAQSPTTEDGQKRLYLPLISQPVTAEANSPGSTSHLQDSLSEFKTASIVDNGEWPAQTDAFRGDIRPNQYGPQRNDPAEGIPIHAYSPFDERNNREHPCPVGDCEIVSGQVLVKFTPEAAAARRGVQASAVDATFADLGVVSLTSVFPNARPPVLGATVTNLDGVTKPVPDLTTWYQAILAEPNVDVTNTVERLGKLAGVAWVEPVYVRKPVGEPALATAAPPAIVASPEQVAHNLTSDFNDPLYPQQWHLAATNVPAAWQWLSDHSLPPGGARDVVVAVIDTGVDLDHPDLAANLWVNAPEFAGQLGVDDDGNGYVDDRYGANLVTNSGNPDDDHGHGTHVAGIIAAQAGNGIGGVGVAYNVQIMALKAAQYSGVLASSDIAEAIYYAVQKGADVINMSFGGYTRSQIEEDALAVAFSQAVLVAAAGNDHKVNLPCKNGRDMYPAAYNWVLGVMARNTTPDAQGNYLAEFSNYDCTAQDTHEYELMAPGVDVWSTLPNGQYAAWDGTSMAAPVVSGIAALLRTKWNDKTTYSSRFIMGQIATTGGLMQAYVSEAGIPVSYHVPNAFAGLTTAPHPSVSYLQHWVFDTTNQSPGNDNDGIVDAGETIDLAIVIRNQWGQANPVTVTLEAWAVGAVQPDPYVTMVTDTVNYGAVSSFNVDDNGLIYDSQGAITGVQHPFRFHIAANTPNDYQIPLRLTIQSGNGFDPADPNAPYHFQSYFFLIVQNGQVLPAIINQDLTLGNEKLWIVAGPVLIEAGTTVTMTEGAQLQFFSSTPAGPYSSTPKPKLQVEGTLRVSGTLTNPVELFPSSLRTERPLHVLQRNSGHIEMEYARVINPVFGGREPYGSPYQYGEYFAISKISRSYFVQSRPNCIDYYNSGNAQWDLCTGQSIVNSELIQKSIFQGLGSPYFYRKANVFGVINESLFDSSAIYSWENFFSRNSVFLKNFVRVQSGTQYEIGNSEIVPGLAVLPDETLHAAFPSTFEGRTYVRLSMPLYFDPQYTYSGSKRFMGRYLDSAEWYANLLNGHVVTISGSNENSFLASLLSLSSNDYLNLYPNRDCGAIECYQLFNNLAYIGLNDRNQEGVWAWLDGEMVTYLPAISGQTGNVNDFVYMSGNGEWHTREGVVHEVLLEYPGIVTQEMLDDARIEALYGGQATGFTRNAILNAWRDPNTARWTRLYTQYDRAYKRFISNNYWGTTSTQLIDAAIDDYKDDFNKEEIVYQPILTTPLETMYPFVVDVRLSNVSQSTVTVVGAEPVTFTVTFNRDMAQTLQPQVSFGPDVPFTDFTVQPVNGGWQNSRTWVGTFMITPVTGDGLQLIRVAGARASDDHWLVTGDDSERFAFEIITSGTEAMNLQANGGEGYIDLSWTQDDFDLLAGYNLYRATSQNGSYSRVNTSIIPPQQHDFRDGSVNPGQPYYYKFTVVKSDMSESDFSNVATATPVDTISPVLSHTPVTTATPGLPLTLFADVTDNVAVQSVTLFFRLVGASTYPNRSMLRTTGNRFSATIEGSLLTSPGLEYYIEASDGISTVRSGRADLPHRVTVVNKPVLTAVTPNHGTSVGGTTVTIAGSNFQSGASVTLGGAVCGTVVVVSSSQITCVTPAHFPETVDVIVTNLNGESGSLLRSFTFESNSTSLGLPTTSGGQNDIVYVPINAANVQGLVAGDVTLTFNAGVLHARGATTGSLTPGWNLATNTNTVGQIRLSLASNGGSVSGSGTLAIIEFDVTGSPGATTPLQLSAASLNDGAIPVQTGVGSFNVELVYSISGAIQSWKDGTGVPSVTLTLSGDRLYSGFSTLSGSYTVASVRTDDYVLSPAKSDDVNGISAFDAALILRHAVGLDTLTGGAALAADVNRNGSISSMDAYYVLQKVVDLIALPFPGAGLVWHFSPTERTFSNLNNHQTGQDFTATLLGDVSGNWSPPLAVASASNQAKLIIESAVIDANGIVTIPVSLDPLGAPAYSVEFAVEVQGGSALEPRLTTATSQWLIVANLRNTAHLQVAMASATPVSQPTSMVLLQFQLSSANACLQTTVHSAMVDEQAVDVAESPSTCSKIYLPVVKR